MSHPATPVAIAPADLATAWRILGDVLPEGVTVWVFGSRAKGTIRPGSDLDLAVDAGRPLTRKEATRLSVDFEDSDLPYKVDIVDWHTLSESFRNIIRNDRVELPAETDPPQTNAKNREEGGNG